MDFLHHNLGHVTGGCTVEVTLVGNAANVRLMDSVNFGKYKAGTRYTFYGGLAEQSPYMVPVPHSGIWHVAIDMQDLAGKVKSSVRVI